MRARARRSSNDSQMHLTNSSIDLKLKWMNRRRRVRFCGTRRVRALFPFRPVVREDNLWNFNGHKNTMFRLFFNFSLRARWAPLHIAALPRECPEFYWFVFGIYFVAVVSFLVRKIVRHFIYVNMRIGCCDRFSFVSPKIEHLNGALCCDVAQFRSSALPFCWAMLSLARTQTHQPRNYDILIIHSDISAQLCNRMGQQQRTARWSAFAILNKFWFECGRTLIHRAWLSPILDSQSDNCDRWTF